MSSRRSNDYIDEIAISRALLEFVGRRIRQRDRRITGAAIAKEIGVEDSMVSQVKKGIKSFGLATLARYAENNGMTVGELSLKLTHLAGEAAEIPVAETPVLQLQDLLDGAFSANRSASKGTDSTHPVAHADLVMRYQSLLARSFACLRYHKIPAVALALAFLRGHDWQLLACRQTQDSHCEPIVMHRQPPADLIRVLEGCHDDTDPEKIGHGHLFLYPGDNVVENGESENSDRISFWQELTDLTPGYEGRRIRIVAEPVFRTATGTKHAYSSTMLFVFEYDFVPPLAVREAMALLARPTCDIVGLELNAQFEEASGLAAPASRLPPAPERWRDVHGASLQRAVQELCARLQDDCPDLDVSRVAAWTVSNGEAAGGSLLQVHEVDCANRADRRKRRKPAGVPGERMGPGGLPGAADVACGPHLWEATRHILRVSEPWISDPLAVDRWLQQSKKGQGDMAVLCLPFEMPNGQHSEATGRGALYLWCRRSHLERIKDAIPSIAGQCEPMRICCPVDRQRSQMV